MEGLKRGPEWTRREVAARALIGLAGGVIATVVTDVLWGWTRTTFDRFLVDRLAFTIVSAIVIAVLLRAWYRQLARTDLVSAVIASSLALWLNAIPFFALRSIIKPVAPDLWATLFGNSNNTVAYSVIYGPCVAVALVFVVPLSRAWASELLRERRRWAVRTPRSPT